MSNRKNVIESIRYYLELGFFEDYRSLSDEELLNAVGQLKIEKDELKQEVDYELGSDELLYELSSDYYIYPLDKKRVFTIGVDHLYGDPSAPGFQFSGYVQLMNLLSQISRGKLLPSEMTDMGLRRFQFTLDGNKYELEPNGFSDDPLVLAEDVNSILLPQGYQFEQIDTNPDADLVLLTPEEKQKLEQERGLKFRTPKYWMLPDIVEWLRLQEPSWAFSANYWDRSTEPVKTLLELSAKQGN